ncbi:MAG: alpha-galactosidase [Clostridia bacterium]
MNFKTKITVNGKVYFDTLNCAEFSLETARNDGQFVSTITAKCKIETLKAQFECDFDFGDNIVFANGYQSWTPSKELGKNDKMLYPSKWCQMLEPLVHTSAYGDYKFAKYSKNAGFFHSFSYGYISQGGNSDLLLIGSLNERSGYTIIYFDMNNSKIIIEKDLEGLVLEKNEMYEIVNFCCINDTYNGAFDKYFEKMYIKKPRVAHQNGYTSWYNYYQNISETIINRDLENLSKLVDNVDIFQIDDGYQTAVGDWLSINKNKFPNGMKPVVEKIHAKGLKAGLWLAPFGAQKNSEIVKNHPEWIVRDAKGKMLYAGMNWGGFFTLDIEQKCVREYIKKCFNEVLNVWGFDMVKLDFLYEVAQIPRCGKTRGQLMSEAMDFVRECVGDKLILGCGVPLWQAFGVVDFCRIGADVGLKWKDQPYIRRMHGEDVSCKETMNNTIFRRHLDGRAFCNDPDVCLLRDTNIKMTRQQRFLLSRVNKAFGNLLFVSDDVGAYDDEQKNFINKTFDNKEITEKYGKYVGENLVEVGWTQDGKKEKFVFDISVGKIVR